MSRDAIRVLHVFGAMERGGAELRTIEIMRRVDPQVVIQEFATLSGRAGALAPEIYDLGGAVHPCRLDLGFAPRFVRIVRARKIDVVHSHVFLSSGLALALAMTAGVPRRVAHFRSTSDGRATTARRRAYRAAMRQVIDRTATDIVGVSAGSLAAGWSTAWARDPRCRVIYNGVDPARFAAATAAGIRAELGLADEAPLVVQVGRFDPPKNHLFTAALVPLLPEAHFVFVGRGGTALEAETRRRIAAAGASGRAHFPGERADVGRWLAAADVSLLPSLHEGLPGVVLEALAVGTPVVASDVPGAQEIAAHLDGVSTLSLGAGPVAWAAAVRAHLAARPTATTRRRLRDQLAASPFTLTAAVAAHVDLWTQGQAVRGRR
ncbi:MAG: glycosyltransferase [Myxococcales bacterium]|nr:glycosyltransferase [Myxococcales bacterium]